MIRLRLEAYPAGLFKSPGNQRVDDVVPGLQDGLVVEYSGFLLLGVAQFQGLFQAAAGEDRQAHAWSHHVLQGTALPEVGVIERVEADRAVELDAGIEGANGNTDGGGCRVQLVFRRPNIRPAPGEFRGDAEWNARRRQRNGS